MMIELDRKSMDEAVKRYRLSQYEIFDTLPIEIKQAVRDCSRGLDATEVKWLYEAYDLSIPDTIARLKEVERLDQEAYEQAFLNLKTRIQNGEMNIAIF